jgi:hypothetical protein
MTNNRLCYRALEPAGRVLRLPLDRMDPHVTFARDATGPREKHDISPRPHRVNVTRINKFERSRRSSR